MTSSQIALAGFDITSESFQRLIDRLDLDLTMIEEYEGEVSLPSPTCVVLDWECEESRSLCRKLRQQGVLLDTPMVSVVDDPWSQSTIDAFSLGSDDFLPRTQLPLLEQKLIALQSGGGIVGTSGGEKVVLVTPDREERVLYARQLRRMGFDVQFALEPNGIPRDKDIRLVVISASTAFDEALKKRPDKQPWLIFGKRKDIEAVDVDYEERLRIFDSDEDPAQLVFVANQLLTADFTQLRSSQRLVYGVPVAFGKDKEEHFGFSYNISLGGIFVRTLTPPPIGTELNLHFTPPFGAGRFCLQGNVVWRQPNPVGRGGTPCGFGLQYGELAMPDRVGYEAAYEELLVKDLSENTDS